MSVSAFPLAWPAAIPFVEADFVPSRRQAAGVFGSGRDVVVDRGIPQWTATLKTRKLFASDIGTVRGLRAALRGGQRFILLSDPFRPYPAAYMPAGWGSPARGSSSQAFDGNGLLTAIASSGLPGVGRDVVSLAALPASFKLIAGDYISLAQATSLAVGQYDLTNAAYVKTGATATANSHAAPDGTTTADTLTRTTAGASYALQSVSKAAIATAYTWATDVHISSGNFLAMRLQGSSAANCADVCFNLSTAAISLAAAITGAFTGASASIVDIGGGFFRCKLKATSDAAAALGFAMSSATVSQKTDGTGSGASSSAFVWNMDLHPTGADIVSLHQVLDSAQVTGDGSGNITVWVEPEIPTQFTTGAVAMLLNAPGKFRIDPTKFSLPIQAEGRNRPGQASFTALSTLL